MKLPWRRFRGAPISVADEATRLTPIPAGTGEKFVLALSDGRSQEYTLAKANITIGRATANDIVLSDVSVSRNHATVERSSQGCEIADLGSANGIKVNGIRVPRAILRSGDEFSIGESRFRFETNTHEREPDLTRINSEGELAATLLDSPLPVHLAETALPRLAIFTSSRTWEVQMSGDALSIGRQPDSDICIDSSAVSRHHAVLEHKAGGFIIRDLHSGNGTWLRNQRVDSSVIEDGDTIRIGPARMVFKRGFAASDLTIIQPRLGHRTARRPVVFIPGFAGSTLWHGSEKIWPSRQALTQIDLMSMDRPLEAKGLVNEVVIVPNLIKQEQYGCLTDYLKENLHYEAGNDLMEFAYDFRQDNRESAKKLAEAIDSWNVKGPITIIAHSMGCLVARYFIERLGGKGKVERVIFLGGPHAGTPYAFASLLKGPNLLPLGLFNERLRKLLATYPSWYQILPTYQFVADQRSAFDVLSEESWAVERHRPLLKLARDFRAELGCRSSVPSVCVFGYGIKTITSATVEREPDGICEKAALTVTPSGDGMIPEVSGVIEASEIHPVRQHHGSLYGDSDVKMRIKLELTRDSSSLSSTP
jgi:pSer/pThr/pTyr-binding forkhead associated (FHA) protein